jgi:hypothetical protein
MALYIDKGETSESLEDLWPCTQIREKPADMLRKQNVGVGGDTNKTSYDDTQTFILSTDCILPQQSHRYGSDPRVKKYQRTVRLHREWIPYFILLAPFWEKPSVKTPSLVYKRRGRTHEEDETTAPKQQRRALEKQDTTHRYLGFLSVSHACNPYYE